MKTISKIALLLVLTAAVMFASCSKNYYSGSGKGGKGCGCPSTKGGGGW
ncbi:MAG: hypothetical protein U0U70_00925 [Chitinophagaceae bacterium]